MAKTDGNVYTVVFATIMVVVVGGVLAAMAQGLKPAIKENERFEKQQNILYAMGVNENVEGEGGVNFIPTDRVEAEYQKYIKESYIIQNGEINATDEAFKVDMKKQSKLPKSERKLPLFVGERDGQAFYVVPMYGKGLWDAIWGYIALDKDLVVQGAFFDHKGETPGLGADINATWFEEPFTGKKLFNADGSFEGINVYKGGSGAAANAGDLVHGVDAISGGTITSVGLEDMLTDCLSAYEPYLKQQMGN